MKSTCVVKKVTRADAVVAFLRHQGKRGGKQRAADAIADRVDLALAGRLLDGVEPVLQAFADIGLPALVRRGARPG